jgi:hypothetical protein
MNTPNEAGWPLDGKHLIVKVQLSLYAPGDRTFLVYDRQRKFTYEGVASQKILDFMGGAVVQYSTATLRPDARRGPDKYLIHLRAKIAPRSW